MPFFVKNLQTLAWTRLYGSISPLCRGDEDMEKLNTLAWRIKKFSDDRTLMKYKAVLELELCNELDMALDIAGNLDCYDFDPKIVSPRQC